MQRLFQETPLPNIENSRRYKARSDFPASNGGGGRKTLASHKTF